MSRLLRPAFATALLLAALAANDARADDPDTYRLDSVSRTVPARGKLDCPKVDLVHAKGTVIPYHAEIVVSSAFVERLTRFEGIVRDVAVEIYGRAPVRIHHLGTYSCRRIGGYPELLSEHALGNGIDIDAFDFGELPKQARADSTLPRALQGSFRVSVLQHWRGKGPIMGLHQRFLDTLARRLVARRDVFRVLLGPSYPGHKNHFHFDVAPYRLVDIWDSGA